MRSDNSHPSSPGFGQAPTLTWPAVLRALRRARGVSQEGWAAHLGVSRRTVQRWERGELPPDARAEAAILEFCREADLFRRSDHGALAQAGLTPDALRTLLAEARVEFGDTGRHRPPASVDSGRAPPSNLPLHLTSLIGREREVGEVIRLLRSARLVTLTGPGGVGKTRLAIAAAEAMRHDYLEAVWFVDLASIKDPLVAAAIGHALGLRASGGDLTIGVLAAYLRDRRALLVLDNFEQVTRAGPVLLDLLAVAPSLTCLVTSRAVLRLSGEQEYAVAPLPVPRRSAHRRPAALAANPAVALFLERARAVRPDLQITVDNADAVAEICARLDGLPLALELAAVRTRLFDPPALLLRLEQRLPYLSGGPRDRPARQQTLRGAIGWSYDLLTPFEQRVFRSLGIFAGGCTLDAAAPICGTAVEQEAQFLDTVTSLLDQNLIRRRAGPDGEPRIGMLATIQEYAREQLLAGGEYEAAGRRHRDWYLHWVRSIGESLARLGSRATIERLEADHDNLRAALNWSLDARDTEAGLRLAVSLWTFWVAQGYFAEAAAWLDRALGQPGNVRPRLRARALWQAGWLAKHDDRGRSHAYLEESLALYREADDRAGVAGALRILGDLAHERGDLPAARAAYRESLTLHRAADDRSGAAQSLGRLGQIAAERGNYARARVLHREAAALQRAAGDENGVGWTLHHLAVAASQQGDGPAAQRQYEESLRIFRSTGDRPSVSHSLHCLAEVALLRAAGAEAAAYLGEAVELDRAMDDWAGVAGCLAGFAGVAALLGDAARAVRLLGAASALIDRYGVEPDPTHAGSIDQTRRTAHAALGDSGFAAAWEQGRADPPDEALARARQSAGDAPGVEQPGVHRR